MKHLLCNNTMTAPQEFKSRLICVKPDICPWDTHGLAWKICYSTWKSNLKRKCGQVETDMYKGDKSVI